MPFHRNALVLWTRAIFSPAAPAGMQLACSHFFLWIRRTWCLSQWGEEGGDTSTLQPCSPKRFLLVLFHMNRVTSMGTK